jgi:hypothetical protein
MRWMRKCGGRGDIIGGFSFHEYQIPGLVAKLLLHRIREDLPTEGTRPYRGSWPGRQGA